MAMSVLAFGPRTKNRLRWLLDSSMAVSFPSARNIPYVEQEEMDRDVEQEDLVSRPGALANVDSWDTEDEKMKKHQSFSSVASDMEFGSFRSQQEAGLYG